MTVLQVHYLDCDSVFKVCYRSLCVTSDKKVGPGDVHDAVIHHRRQLSYDWRRTGLWHGLRVSPFSPLDLFTSAGYNLLKMGTISVIRQVSHSTGLTAGGEDNCLFAIGSSRMFVFPALITNFQSKFTSLQSTLSPSKSSISNLQSKIFNLKSPGVPHA